MLAALFQEAVRECSAIDIGFALEYTPTRMFTLLPWSHARTCPQDDDDDDEGDTSNIVVADTVDAYLHKRFEHLVGSPILPSTPGTSLPRLRFAGLTTVRHAGGGLRVLPTEHAAFILEPGVDGKPIPPALSFVLDNFSTDALSSQVLPGADLLLLATVQAVGVPERVRDEDRAERLVVSLSDFDNSPPSRRELVLWDDETALARLLHRGDVVALARPRVPHETDENGRYRLEYGAEGTLFLMPNNLLTDSAREQLSQAVSPPKASHGRGEQATMLDLHLSASVGVCVHICVLSYKFHAAL
jgi:hypothetical protein